MGDELIVRARQNCCRLCLAPESECISILNGFASDKEPLSNKIYACVNIKISKTDNLSQKICHFCVSYLNSWQSFKNRCIASQKKQQIWLDNTLRNVQKQLDDIRASRQNDENYTITKTTSTPTNKECSLLPNSIKEEPIFDDDGDETMKVDLDPSDFLARNDEDETDELKRLAANQNLTITKSVSGNDGGPPILTSLGLTSVLPFNFLSTELGQEQSTNFNNSTDIDTTLDNNDSSIIKTAACHVCKLTFSTRANARRHERNIHFKGLLENQSGASSPTPSLSSLNALTTATNLQDQQTQQLVQKPNIPTHNANGEQRTPQMRTIYEYNKPEKYRHLFTEQLLNFIEQYSEFLRQYQNLSCICCNKEYPTYKSFMAHMRKKYPKLPRNLCFKCLTQFETKSQFVSHVKRRNCINYFKLYLLDDKIPKRTPQTILAEKTRAKELLTNKLYECKICPKKFRLKLDFRNHIYVDHSEIQKTDVLPGHCAFCGLEIEDPVERKRHYNNMECIVYISCGTCNEKFDTHTKFLNHVYAEHLPKLLANEELNTSTNINLNSDNLIPGQQMSTPTTATSTTTFHSRMPQSCKICGQHYNNYNNVLRHMESKHPDQLPQTYKCSICDFGFPRLSSLRTHMHVIHNTKMAKPKRVMGIYCRMCMEKFDQRQHWLMHQVSEHNRYVCCVCNFQSKDTDNFIEHIEQHPSLSSNHDNSNTNDNKSYSGRYDYVMKDLLSITNGSGTGGNDGDDENDDNDFKQQIKRIKLEPSSSSSTTTPKNNFMLPAKAECKICHAIFNSNLGLSNHMRAHNAQQEAKRTANNDLTSKPLRNTQVLAVERRFRRMRCRLCQKRFSTKKIYRRHMFIEHQIRNVQFIHCAVCKAEFAHEKGLKVHMIKVHGKVLKDISEMNLQFECDVCSTVYRTEDQLMSHKKSVHNLDDEMDFLDQSLTESNISLSGSNTNTNTKIEKPNVVIPPNQSTNYWYQCRYCASNFDTNKKLAIHINCHDEFDSNDYSCKDCGNVYSGRKSLWVHRYKKHPLIPDPAPCEICQKTFFDRNMLEQHLIHSHKQKITKNNNAAGNNNKLIAEQQWKQQQQQQLHEQQLQQQQRLQQQQLQQQQKNLNDTQIITTDDDYEHDDDDDDNSDVDDNDQHIIHVSGEDVQTVAALDLPQVPCSVCGIKFSDQDLFTKHMQMHEMMLYTDNPLASMFDTEPEDPDTFLANRINENGEYMCDICPKTFPQLTALKVHRNWHFRSDGKQIPADPNTVWRSTAKKRKNPSATLKCQYCQSSFISSNNLKRHVAELHRRELAPNTAMPDIVLEKPLECTKCSLKFKTNAEWVEHKLNDAKIGKPYAPFEWGCEICGKVVSRKERLIQHMTAHIKDNEPNGNSADRASVSEQKENNSIEGKLTFSSIDENSVSASGGIKSENGYNESDSEDSSSSSSDSSSTSSNNRNENEDENSTNSGEKVVKKSDDDNNDEEEKKSNKRKANLIDSDDDENKTENQKLEDEDDEQPPDDEEVDFDLNTDVSDNDDDNEDDSDAEDDDDDDDEDDPNDSGPHSCDLCQLDFDTSKQLRKHVTSHFVNGPEESSKASTSTVGTAIGGATSGSPVELPKSPVINAEKQNTVVVKDEVVEVDDEDDYEVDDDDDNIINDIEVVKEEFVHDGYEEIEEDGEVIMVPPM